MHLNGILHAGCRRAGSQTLGLVVDAFGPAFRKYEAKALEAVLGLLTTHANPSYQSEEEDEAPCVTRHWAEVYFCLVVVEKLVSVVIVEISYTYLGATRHFLATASYVSQSPRPWYK